MTLDDAILASLLDDCWEPASTAAALRAQVSADDPRLGEARIYCLLVPDGDTAKAMVVPEDEVFDDSEPPDNTRWLWVIASRALGREDLLRLFELHG